MMTLGDLCDLVAGRVTMLVELKSRFDGDARLPIRVADSFRWISRSRCADVVRPEATAVLRQKAPSRRADIATKYRPHPYYDLMPAWLRYGMGYLLPALMARPQFIAYGVSGLPAFAPLFARQVLVCRF